VSQLPHLQYYQQRVDKLLSAKLDSFSVNDPKLLEAMRYGLLIGGKRMRPYLVYITGETLGVEMNDLDAIACAIECIHAYSLLHDDLPAMDDDDLRRGKPTCHKAFDEATAILAGDSLQTLAFDFLANNPLTANVENKRTKLFQLLVKASGYSGMCGGQALDLNATNQAISLDDLAQLHALKTGALLKASIEMAAECACTINTQQKKQLTLFAELIGLAYQVQDDIIDITSSEEELGKPKGSDVEANKSTYPSLLGLEGAKQKAEDLYQESLQALATLPYNTQNLAEFATFIVRRTH